MILQYQKFRKDFYTILESAILSVKPETLLKNCIHLEGDTLRISRDDFNLSDFSNIHVIGMGKGTPSLCNAITGLLGDRVKRGIIISGELFDTEQENVISLKGDHPVPGVNSLKAAEKLKQFVKKVKKNDLVIALLTGGASAMAVSPSEEISIKDISGLNNILIKSGASIEEINTVRKHVSTIKGGMLARMIHPAKIISLIISDVVGSDPEIIGSAPFYGDSSTFADALKILQKFRIGNKVKENIIDYLKRGETGEINETPSPDDPVLKNNRTYIIGKNRNALQAAALRGKEMGYRTNVMTKEESGDVREAAIRFGKIIRKNAEKKATGEEISFFGGEFTVSVKGEGRGGRVQEFLLLLLRELKDENYPFFIAGAGTDGRDGNSDSAGAWIDNRTIGKLEGEAVPVIDRYLAGNNSNAFFKKIDQLIHTGITGTNVMDIYMIFQG